MFVFSFSRKKFSGRISRNSPENFRRKTQKTNKKSYNGENWPVSGKLLAFFSPFFVSNYQKKTKIQKLQDFSYRTKISNSKSKNWNLAKRTKREKTPRKNSKKSYNGENESFFDQKSWKKCRPILPVIGLFVFFLIWNFSFFQLFFC